MFDGSIVIAPFWSDIDIRIEGQVFYRYSTDFSLLAQVANTIGSLNFDNFFPNLLFIATWYRVAEFGGNNTNVSFNYLLTY